MRRALLLNASYEPLCLVAMKRAVVLLLEGKAEIVEQGSGEWRSATQEFPVPSVLRLTKFVKVPFRARVPLNRRAVMSRDRGLCQYCGKPGDTIDHVIPRSRGGKHRWENVVLCCKRCNARKDDKLLSEIGWTLKTEPFAPRGQFWIVVGILEIDPAWEPYLGLEEAVA